MSCSASTRVSNEKLDTSAYEDTDEFFVIPQDRYKPQSSKCDVQPSISFVDEANNPALLHSMLQQDFKNREEWKRPWMTSMGQKISIRARLEAANGVTAVVDKQVNVRFGKNHEPCTQLKLGEEIARTLRNSDSLKTFCAEIGCGFEDLAIYELRHVSKASWQVVLGVKAGGLPLAPA